MGMRFPEDIRAIGNFYAHLREGGKIVPGSRREGHNIFTTNGRNWLAKLVSWYATASTDVPFTNRRVRWLGMGRGSQIEATTVASLAIPVLATTTQYMVPIQAVEFPTATSVRFIKEFLLNEITLSATPVVITEAGLFADVNPANAGLPNDGSEDAAQDPGNVDTTLNPSVGTNPPVAYKAFEPLTKTIDFTLEVRWDFRFE